MKDQERSINITVLLHCRLPFIARRFQSDSLKMAKARNAAHAEEKAEVEVLFAEAVKSGELAKKLRALQASLEGGGRTVRDAIGPVHSNTREHQTMIQSTSGLYTKYL